MSSIHIDCQAELRELSQEEWIHRYTVERYLEDLYAEEELYWRQIMGKHWLWLVTQTPNSSTNLQMGGEEKGPSFNWKLTRVWSQPRRRLCPMLFNFTKTYLGLWSKDLFSYQITFGLIVVKSRRLIRKI